MTTFQNMNQLSLKSLTRTPSGQVYHHDLKNIFSVLLYCLQLKDESKKPSSSLIKFSFKKQHPYSFTIEKAVEIMSNLQLNLQYNVTLTILSYEMKPDFALELLETFYAAKLLHCPDDKTAKQLSPQKMILQPTPKGVAFLHQFCLKMGIPNIKGMELPAILQSNFNSMQLIEFERHSRTDSIIHNENSDKLLFVNIMGPKVNIWSSKNGPDSIPDRGSNLMLQCKKYGENYSVNIDFSNALQSNQMFHQYLRNRQQDIESVVDIPCDSSTSEIIGKGGIRNIEKTQISPFYHRFFTNPESDSHVQYYVSNSGLRFFKTKIVHTDGNDKIINECFSGKSLIQYLLDCTDLIYYKDALKVANLFLKFELITCESINDIKSSKQFLGSKDALYKLTDYGYQLVKWPSNEQSAASSHGNVSKVSTDSKFDVSLENILKDPGLKFLLRQFMVKNISIENLNVYDDITDFQKKMNILKKMVSLKNKEKKKFLEELENVGMFKESKYTQLQSNAIRHKKLTIYTAMNKLSENCLSKVYAIFSMYISEDAPNEINIDSRLRFQIQNLIQNNSNFETSCMAIAELKGNLGLDSAQSDSEVDENLTDLERSKTSESGKLSVEKPTNITLKEVKEKVNLTLNLKHLRDFESSQVSPTEIIFGPKLKFLQEIAEFYKEIKREVYRIMETDSYSKFLESEQYRKNYCCL